MPDPFALSRPASWQSQELCPLFWRTASSKHPVLAQRIDIRITARFCFSSRFIQIQKDQRHTFEKEALARVSGNSKKVLEYCGRVVGKVVKSMWVSFALYQTSTAKGFIVTKNVFISHSLVAVFKQLSNVSAQLFLVNLQGFRVGFYTLNTGLTNTNKLNKGIIL